MKDVPDAAKANFQNVPDSMFTLFVLMNGEVSTVDDAWKIVEWHRLCALQEWPDVMPLLDAQSPQSCKSVLHDTDIFCAERQLHAELRCPSLKFMFVLFIIISTWALLSAGSPG